MNQKSLILNRVMLVVVGIIFFLAFGAVRTQAASRFSVASGNWNATSTWSTACGGSAGSSAPVAGDDVTICDGFTVTVTADAACATVNYTTGNNGSLSRIAVNSGITLAVSGNFTMQRPPANNTNDMTIGSGIVTIGGNLAIQGTTGGSRTSIITISTGSLSVTGNISFSGTDSQINFSGAGTLNLGGSFGTGGTFTQSTSTVNFNGSSAQTTSTGYTFYNIKSNNTAGLTLGEAETINNLTIGDVTGSSIFSDGGFQLTSTATLTLTSGTFKLGGSSATTFPAFTAGKTISAGTTVEYQSTAAQTVDGSVSYQNLTITGASTKTTGANTTVAQVLTINTGATFSMGANHTLSVTGATNVTGTLANANTGVKTYTGLVTINSGGSFTNANNSNITFKGGFTNNSAGTVTFGTGTMTFNTNDQNISGSNTVSMANLAANVDHVHNNVTSPAYLEVTTALSGSGTLTQNQNTILYIGGTSTVTTLDASTNSGNTVNYNANGNQTACIVTTYQNLTLSGTGTNTKTFATTPTVNGTLSMQGTATITVTTGVVTYGAAAKLQYNTTTSRTASSEEWITPFAATGGVQISSTGTITMNEAKVFSADVPLTVDSGGALNTGNYQLSLGGNFTATGATLTFGSSVIVIGNGTATQSITGFTTTGACSMTKTGGTATLGSATSCGSFTFNGSGGTLSDGGVTITITGTGAAWAITAGTYTTTGTTKFTGTAPTIGASNFNNLTIDTTGSNTATLTGTATIAGNLTVTSGILDLSSYSANRSTSGGTLTLSGTATLKIGGTGTIPSNYTTHSVASGTTVEFAGTTQSIPALNSSQNYGNLTVSAGTATLGATITPAGNLTVSGGTLATSTYTVNRASSGGTLTLSGTGTLKLESTNTIPSNYTTHSVASGTTVEFAGTTQSIPALNSSQNYGNLTVSAGTATLGATITPAGNLTVSGGTLATSSYTVNRSTSGGSMTISNGATLQIGNTGTIPTNYSTHSIGATSTIDFAGSTQTIPALNSSQTYGILTISAAGTKSLGAAITVTTTLNITTGTLDDAGFQLTSTGTLNLNSGVFSLGSAGAATSWPAFGTTNITAGATVTYASGVAQDVSTTPGYSNLTFSGAGTKTTASGTLTIGGNWSAGSTTALNTYNTIVNLTGSLNGSGSITQGTGLITISGSWTNTGTFTASAAGVTMNGASTQFSGSGDITFTTLTIDNTVTNNRSGTITVGTALSGSSTLTQGSGAALTIGGTSGITGLTATASNTVTYSKSGDQNIHGTTTYYNLVTSGSGTKTLQTSTTTISGDITVGAGTTLAASGDLALSGNLTTTTSGIVSASAGTVSVNAASKAIGGGSGAITFYGLTLANNGTTTINSDITVSNTLNVTTSDTLSIAASKTVTIPATLTFPDTAVISGSGTLIYQSSTSFPTTGTLSAPLRFDATNNIQTVPVRTYSGAVEFYNGSNTNTRTITLGADASALTFGSNVTLNSAGSQALTVTPNGSNPQVNITGSLAGTAGGTAELLTLGGSTWVVTGAVNLTGITLDSTGSTFQMNGTANLTSAGSTFNNFSVTGNTVTAQDATDINGNFSVTSGGFVMAGGAVNMNVAGNFSLSNTTSFTGNTSGGYLIFDGTTYYTDSNGTTVDVGDVKIGNSPGTTYLSSDMSANSLTIALGDTYYTCGWEADIGNGGITVNGTMDLTRTASGCSSDSDQSTVNDANAFNLSGTGVLTPDQSTFIFDDNSGTNNLTTAGTGTFYNMQISNASNTMLLKDALDVDNNLTISAGTLDAETGNGWQINIGGNWDNDGVFEARGGLVIFDGQSGTKTIDADGTGNEAFYNLTFDDSPGAAATFQLTTSLDVDNNLTITNGTFDTNGQTITVGGNYDNDDTMTMTSGTLTMNAQSGTKTIDADGTGTEAFYNLTFDDTPGAAATFQLTTALDVDANLTITGGTLDTNSQNFAVGGNFDNDDTLTMVAGTMTMNGTTGTKTIDTDGTGTEAIYNLTFDDGGNSATYQLSTLLDVDNNLTITGGTFDTNGQTITVGGNYDNDDTMTMTSGTLTMNGTTGTKTIDADGTGTEAFYNLTFDDGGNSATYQITTSLDVDANLTITGGTFDTNGQDFSIGGNYDNDDTMTMTSGTLTMNATTGAPTIDADGTGTEAFYNLTFNDGGNNITFQLTTALDVDANLTITGGTLDTNSQNFAVGGNFDNDDTLTMVAGTMTMNGTTGTKTIDADGTGTEAIYNLTFDDGGNSATYQLTTSLDVDNNLTITGGTFDTNGQNFAVGGNYDNDDTMTMTSGTATFNAQSGTKTIDADGTGTEAFYNITFDDTPGGGATFQLSTALDTNGNLTITGGTLDSNSNNISVAGNWTNSDTFGETTATVTLDGLTSTTLDSGCADYDSCTTKNFYNLYIDKTDGDDANDNVTLSNTHLNVANTLTVNDGELVQGIYNVRSEGTSAVSVASGAKWTNISTGDLKLGGSFANAGTVTFQSSGAACGDAHGITITSTTTDQRSWTSSSGTFNMNDLDVSYQAGTASITVYSGTGTSTGANWVFVGCPQTVTGSVYAYGTTNPLSGCDNNAGTYELALYAEGATYSASCSDVDGSFSFSNVGAPETTNAYIFWIDSAVLATQSGALVTRYDGTGGSASNIFYDNTVTVTSDDTNPVTIDIMNNYDYVNDNDIPYTATSATPDTLVVNSGHELLVKIKSGVAADSTVFDPGGTVTTNATGGDLHVVADSTAYLDTATSAIGRDIEVEGSSTLYIDADTTVGGGDITTSGTSAVVSTSAGTPTVTISGTGSIGGGTTPTLNFYNLAIAAGAATTIASDINIDGGSLTTGASSSVGYSSTPTVDIDGTGTLGGNSVVPVLYTLDLGDGTSDTTTLGSGITIDNALTVNTSQLFAMSTYDVTVGSTSVSGSGDIAVNGSTSQSANGTLTVKSSSGGEADLTGSGTLTVYNLAVGDSGTVMTLDQNTADTAIDIANNLTITASAILSATSGTGLSVGGDYSNSGTFTANGGTITFDSTDAGDTLGGTMTGASAFSTVIFNDGGNSGTWTFGTNSADVTNDFTITAGALTASSTTLTIGKNFQNDDSFIHNSGTIEFNNALNDSILTYAATTTFNHFTVDTPGKHLLFDNTDGVVTDINGNLTLQGSNCTDGRVFLDPDVPGQEWHIDASGSTDIDYIDVEWSNAVTPLTAYASTAENGNNSGWTINGDACSPNQVGIRGDVRIKGGVVIK